MAKWQYTKGLHDLGNGCLAYLQPDGSWGWSNAGLIVDGSENLLVDTLFDLKLTRQMLNEMRDKVPSARKIKTLNNGSKKKLPASSRCTMVIIALPNSPSRNCHLWSKLRTKRETLCHRPGKRQLSRERRRRKLARWRNSKAGIGGLRSGRATGRVLF